MENGIRQSLGRICEDRRPRLLSFSTDLRSEWKNTGRGCTTRWQSEGSTRKREGSGQEEEGEWGGEGESSPFRPPSFFLLLWRRMMDRSQRHRARKAHVQGMSCFIGSETCEGRVGGERKTREELTAMRGDGRSPLASAAGRVGAPCETCRMECLYVRS